MKFLGAGSEHFFTLLQLAASIVLKVKVTETWNMEYSQFSINRSQIERKLSAKYCKPTLN